MNKILGSLAVLALTLLPPGLSARAQTNAAAYDQDLIAQARAAAAEFPPTNWVLPILVSNSPPFDLMGQYYSLQHVDWTTLPFPPWQNVNAWCLDPTHQIWVYDDRDLDFSGRGLGSNWGGDEYHSSIPLQLRPERKQNWRAG